MKKLSITILTFAFAIISTFAQTDKELGLHSEGGPWNFYPTKEFNPELPNVLLIGNSVMNGYKNIVIPGLKGKTNVDYWLTPKHLKSDFLFEDLARIVRYRKYDVIQFNIGLHGWPEGRIAENEYVPLLEKYVATLKENAGDAQLIWGTITPVTETGKPELNREINPTIVKRNKLAKEVMKNSDIPVNDLYNLAANRLELAKGDRFHWKAEGYKLMGNQTIAFILAELKKRKEFPSLADYNVVWHSPSKNSMGSMPAGNGDIGINLWVEENGDLLFYLSKTDAWSENARLLKIGKIRLSLSPNPFVTDNSFLQELKLVDGVIKIEAGDAENFVLISTWIDANNPVVEMDIKSTSPLSAKVTTEPWRTERRQITIPNELHSAYELSGKDGPDVFVEKDEIIKDSDAGVIWLHRNERSIWQNNLKLQGLDEFIEKSNDPLLYRTFGGLIRSAELEKTAPNQIGSVKPLEEFSVSVFVLTAQTENKNEWISKITEKAEKTESLNRAERFKNHKMWWQSFWNRSYINISTKNSDEKETVFNVTRNYALQRYINACGGRGGSPIKFNGTIFTVDSKNIEGDFSGFDADYRRWGGPFWWQNTRLPYWSMLESGDFDLMQPLFKMYREALPIRKLATEKYYHHKGAFFPETMTFWGTYSDNNYGRDRSELPLGMTQNLYIRYYWGSGLEVSLMMLDYYAFTQDKTFLKETLLPVASLAIDFFDQHWGRDKNGKILFDPAMALETYWKATNPLPIIAGINKVCTELLKLPAEQTSKEQKRQWQRLLTELPDIPVHKVDGELMLAPAQKFSEKHNVENPELYAVFPYRTFMIEKDGLEMARRTFANRAYKQTGGWQQNAIQAAYLGLTDEAAKLTSTNFNTWNPAYRFPTNWGPNYDWTPDQDHGSVALIALQRMLLQYDNDKIYLLGAWPKSWDVEFKLVAPQNTVVTGKVKNGAVEWLRTTPATQQKNVVVAKDYK
jgi:hypothetical protein